MSTTFYDDRPGVPEAQRKLLHLTHNPIEPTLETVVLVAAQEWIVTRIERHYNGPLRTYDIDIYVRPLRRVPPSGQAILMNLKDDKS